MRCSFSKQLLNFEIYITYLFIQSCAWRRQNLARAEATSRDGPSTRRN